ncbi:NAD(P)/FAD-dependent oxidoreductase [Anoxybacterium hadale]|uniref:NAD(P)/FAD-dependent oxidoreductase n=1 Tax=Anoxybacterium hadale TaxID=3408580 RepID=A0ACD1A8B2_9FIRM|nr:NAD(P)/FAD-dependent oxidoreductase [Clostridiales bacterium]
MPKSIIIIGAGMGGLTAGIYGQKNGFETRIYEMNHRPGGQCTSWKRGEYTFDACIHHLMGCAPKSKLNMFWREIGAMSANFVRTKECVSVASSDGTVFYDYYDPDELEKHLLQLSPQDKGVISEYIQGIRKASKFDMTGNLIMGNYLGILLHLPAVLGNMKWFKVSMGQFAERFRDPFLKKAFPLLVYSNPEVPVFLHMMRHASGYKRDIAWPIGASNAFVAGIVKQYEGLGGKIHLRRKVEKIITEHGRAVGIRLADGTEEFADIVISNADGRKTLLELLDGSFMDDTLRSYCAEPADLSEFAVTVYIGVNRDLTKEPSSMILLLDEPVTLGDQIFNSLEMQAYGFDKTMAPEGKGVIKVEFRSTYSYWKELSSNKEDYNAEKKKTADRVIGLLEARFPGIKEQVEAVDVSTLLTWERFMGGTHGFNNAPSKEPDFISSMVSPKGMTVPGLKNFYFTGIWTTGAGALFLNALSGKKAIKKICKENGMKFQTEDK